ncbi:hypothetical protein GCM10010502_60230 [Kitasatospora aureofaciens]|uniref:Uncharacterized protein n=1 Tax=Kitasatospora aureofaciens TaxID=1894 RepID=A0A8H9HXF6_KITAU|nr:hypothetical protein GCM10010502_60230 [Kitasatospora aureofaciens]
MISGAIGHQRSAACIRVQRLVAESPVRGMAPVSSVCSQWVPARLVSVPLATVAVSVELVSVPSADKVVTAGLVSVPPAEMAALRAAAGPPVLVIGVSALTRASR